MRWVSRLALLAPTLFLILLAVPRFQSGLAIDAAYPVPTYMIVGASLPQSSYRDTAAVLGNAFRGDGETLLRRAEAVSLMQPEAEGAVGLFEEGLTKSPTSVRGWALLAEHLASVNRTRAAQALGQSLLLGPYEYYVAARRARQAAIFWDDLPADAHALALRQARLLWTEASLNEGILRLLAVDGGAELIARAFQDEPEELRAINRWVAAERR